MSPACVLGWLNMQATITRILASTRYHAHLQVLFHFTKGRLYRVPVHIIYTKDVPKPFPSLIARGEGGTWVMFCWVCAAGLSEPQPQPNIVYSVANYRPHLSHFLANVIVISRTEFNASRLLNIKTTTGTIFQPPIFLF